MKSTIIKYSTGTSVWCNSTPEEVATAIQDSIKYYAPYGGERV